MALRKAKSTSPGRRFVLNVVDQDLYKDMPLTAAKSKNGGRNNYGVLLRVIKVVDISSVTVLLIKRNKDGVGYRAFRI